MKEMQRYDLLDILAIFQTGLSVLNYQENIAQSTNNDIMRELDKQTKIYLVKIIEQNEQILSLMKGEKHAQKDHRKNN